MTEEIANETKETKETEKTEQMVPEPKNNQEGCCCSKQGESLSLKGIVQIVYLCQALSFFFGITFIVGVIISYLKRDEAKGSWLESHFVWQIRTFWFGLAASIAGFILMFVLIGFLILAANLVWIVYRVVKGWILLSENRPITDSAALI